MMSGEIVVTSNCQTGGVAAALEILTERKIIAVPVPSSEAQQAALSEAVRACDVWVRTPDPTLEQFGKAPREIRIPRIRFDAFHPDITSPQVNGRRLRCLNVNYNSKIGLWCWRAKITPSDALALFSKHIFDKLGYFDIWAESLTALRTEFEATDIDFDRFWLRLKREVPFMHTINHPKISALCEIAKQVAVQLGGKATIFDEPMAGLVPDALGAVVWPVYPAIAEHYGYHGLYRWRLRTDVARSLGDYLDRAYASYTAQALDREKIVCGAFTKRFDATLRAALGASS